MRKKLVITRVGRQAPQSSQVWPEELPVPLAERAEQLYPLIASGTGTREEYLVLRTGRRPAELMANVCTPGGSTIAGVHMLEQHAFRAAVMDALCESCDRMDSVGRRAQ